MNLEEIALELMKCGKFEWPSKDFPAEGFAKQIAESYLAILAALTSSNQKAE